MRYSILSGCLLASLSVNANSYLYEDAVGEYCKSFFNDIPLASCIDRYNESALEKGVDVILEEIEIENAIGKAFDDGKFTVNELDGPYRSVEIVVSPIAINSYIEDLHNIFYFNTDMSEIKHIIIDFRNGLYGGYNGKQIDNEVVRIERINASLHESSEAVYTAPSWPDFDYQQINVKDFKLYRYKMKNGDSYVTPSYSVLSDSAGSEGEWWPSLGHQPSLNSADVPIQRSPELGGSGNFDADIVFGYEVYLLVKFNEDKSVDIGMPIRDITGVLTMDPKNIRTLFLTSMDAPSKPKLSDGWFPYTPTFKVEDYSDWTSRFATTIIDRFPRFVCRFEQFNGKDDQTVFGYIQVINQDKDQTNAICTTGNQVYIETINGKKESVASDVNKFDLLSLKDTKLTGQKVIAKEDKQLCSINSNGLYGVGYVNNSKQCVQDGNIFWSNGQPWKLSQGWNYYDYK